MRPPHVEIVVELLADPGHPVAFKISSDYFELNVFVPRALLPTLDRVSTHNWEAGSIRAGDSAGAPVFWCAGEPGQVSVMVGADDETWDFSVSIPAQAFQSALAEAKSLVANRT